MKESLPFVNLKSLCPIILVPSLIEMLSSVEEVENVKKITVGQMEKKTDGHRSRSDENSSFKLSAFVRRKVIIPH